MKKGVIYAVLIVLASCNKNKQEPEPAFTKENIEETLWRGNLVTEATNPKRTIIEPISMYFGNNGKGKYEWLTVSQGQDDLTYTINKKTLNIQARNIVGDWLLLKFTKDSLVLKFSASHSAIFRLKRDY